MDKTKVFVIMPFTDDFFESYEMIKEHFNEDFEFSHAGNEDNQQNILADIIPPIYFTTSIVLFELSFKPLIFIFASKYTLICSNNSSVITSPGTTNGIPGG